MVTTINLGVFCYRKPEIEDTGSPILTIICLTTALKKGLMTGPRTYDYHSSPAVM